MRTLIFIYLNAGLFYWKSNILMVRMEGLEPPRLSTPEPKSGASTNFATSAECELEEISDDMLFSGGEYVIEFETECKQKIPPFLFFYFQT